MFKIVIFVFEFFSKRELFSPTFCILGQNCSDKKVSDSISTVQNYAGALFSLSGNDATAHLLISA